MLRRADSVGVFQVESRAQMNMLPRLKPDKFYDLVIEVAIVRPGPIQGDMVHPYLRRKSGEEEPTYPSDALKEVLHKTLGVPLFQEQAMQIAIVGAGFAPERADQLRRAMATFRHVGLVHTFREEFIAGMERNGYPREFAERCFSQIEGFGTYGFPESHAAAFAQLVYVSAWIKRHHPAAFAAALLNSQPMGFYAPAQLVRDAQEHRVRVRPIDVLRSDWDCTLEPDPESEGGLALRLGLRMVEGLSASVAKRLVETRPAWSPPRGPDLTDGARISARPVRPAVRGRAAPDRADRAEASPGPARPAHPGRATPDRPGEPSLPARPAERDGTEPEEAGDANAPPRSARSAGLGRNAPGRAESAGASPRPARPGGFDHDAPDPKDRAGVPAPSVRRARGAPARPAGSDRDAPARANDAGLPVSPGRSAGLDRAAPGGEGGAGALARLASCAGLDRAALERLAGADAFRGLGIGRRAALWEATAAEAATALPALAAVREPAASLPAAAAGEQTVLDYASTALTLRHHPLALLRPILAAEGLADTRALASARRGAPLRLPGLVLVRQRPGSAKGVVFFTVEDEWGTANLVVYADLVSRFRAAVVSARLVVAEGRVERTEAEVPIVHLIVRRLLDRSDLLFGLAALDRPEAPEPWRRALARADEVEKGEPRGVPHPRLPRSRDFH
jgi:error-prone DNA polymerase